MKSILDYETVSLIDEEDAIEIIEENYSSIQLNVSEIARILGVSNVYLSKCFKQFANRNISDYLCSYRLEKAKLMLASEMTVNEICEACGFGSLRTFMRDFKSSEGLTPGQYRSTLHKEEV